MVYTLFPLFNHPNGEIVANGKSYYIPIYYIRPVGFFFNFFRHWYVIVIYLYVIVFSISIYDFYLFQLQTEGLSGSVHYFVVFVVGISY